MFNVRSISDYTTILQNLSILKNESKLLWAKAREAEPLYSPEAEADFMGRLEYVYTYLKDHIQ
jgi:hypothetical protein